MNMVNKCANQIEYGRRFSLKFSELKISKILAGKIAYMGLADLRRHYAPPLYPLAPIYL